MTSASIGKHTFRLFARPSFVEGMGRLVDVTGQLNTYSYSRTDHEADAVAMRKDWESVGKDLRNAISEYDKLQGTTTQ